MIKDEFTGLPLSRQRIYQLRKERDGLCTICAKPAFRSTTRCKLHLFEARTHNRETAGCKEWQPGSPGSRPVETEDRVSQLKRQIKRVENTIPQLVLT